MFSCIRGAVAQCSSRPRAVSFETRCWPLVTLLLLALPGADAAVRARAGLADAAPAASAAKEAPGSAPQQQQRKGSVVVTLFRRRKLGPSQQQQGNAAWAAGRRGGRSRHSRSESEYYGQVGVGSPQQTFSVVFDTGSGNLLLPSTECHDDACKSHKRFDAGVSATAMQVAFAEKPSQPVEQDGTRDIVTITFGTGDISGVYVRDNICLGPGAGLCCQANFVASTEESDEPFSLVPFDGILGLSLPQLAEGPSFSIMDRLMESDLLDRNLFAVFFGNDNEESEISFGSFNQHHMSTELLWVPVTEQGYWQVRMDGIALAQRRTHFCASHQGGCQAAVDTGTSLLAGPTDVVEALMEKLGVATDCSNLDDLPSIGFIIGNTSLNLEPQDYVSRGSDGQSCSLGLMAIDVPPPKGPLFILGDPFLRKYYTVYDRARVRVGFALARHRPAHLDPVEEEQAPSTQGKEGDESLVAIRRDLVRRPRLLVGRGRRRPGGEAER